MRTISFLEMQGSY